MKKHRKKKKKDSWALETLNIKEITDKYRDKYVSVRTENGRAVLILDTCRIKYKGYLEEYYD
tara:strand:- start:1038 stop:1223 length:186 start_codon:yes stop_codon:yes gene_type:complete